MIRANPEPARDRDHPWWWERTPRPNLGNPELPTQAEVAIIGSGYTGLSAAIETASRGWHTVIFDQADAGFGCSSRNGGQVSTSIKPQYPELTRRYGAEAALAILQEGNNALNWVETVVQKNHIDCDFARVGRFCGAHSQTALDALRQRIATTPAALGHRAYIVERARQHEEIGSDFYHGGMVDPDHAALDPARYHLGLLQRASAVGAEVIPHCRVLEINRIGDGFTLKTTRGAVRAKQVIVATSGYTSALTPWQQRRIIPIGSYIIATEPLPAAVAKRLIPNARVITDTLDLVVYYRLCPERRRLLFGGRVSLNETRAQACAPRLQQLMVARFPELAAVKITHSWMGFVGYTFDRLPHIGQHNGIYYSLGYCGSGISLASYFGMKTGLKVVGDAAGATALDAIDFPRRFYYRGNPWFLAPSIFYYRLKDRLKQSARH